MIAAPAAPVPPFAARVMHVTRAELGRSWRPGCPVPPSQLRGIRLAYWGFDGKRHLGTVVVNETAVRDAETVFRSLYRARFPISSLRPVAAFGGSDTRSMAADNTSGFNCRKAVTTGPAGWSEHAYGLAIDVNTVENPYREAGRWLPPAGKRFGDRTHVRRGMAVPGGVLVRAFAAVGWGWGGRWREPDYQHFSANGR